MLSRTVIFIILFVVYVGFTYKSLKEASLPVRPCTPESDGRYACLQPLISFHDESSTPPLSMELWVRNKVENDPTSSSSNDRLSSSAFQWKPLETCTFLLTDDNNSIIMSSSMKKNCTIDFPQFSRQRHFEETTAEPLKAKFILRTNDAIETTNSSSSFGRIIAEAPFDLTRFVVERREKITGKIMEEYVPFYKYRKQGIVIRLVMDNANYGYPYMRGDGIYVQTDRILRQYYSPILYVDDVALRYSSKIELASSGEGKPPVAINIKISAISPMRDVVIRQVTGGMKMAQSVFHESELDEIRYFITDERLYRFLLTQIISFIHIWLDYLAFKDEIGFYRGKTDMGGLSLSSIVSRFICDLIIFLYLIEGGGTSWIVLFGVGNGVLVEAWKMLKVLKPQRSIHFPFFTVRDPSTLSNTEQQTVNYDRIATTYLSLLLYPLIIGTAIYAKKHYEYSSWYSWFISNLANAVYTFGFISLCPQLYVNYCLKSVAHLPMKVFVYKIFNTFIDDVFAFLIEMPLKHKLMTLRDDIVFFIFLYQAYIYQVDKNRPNEFGYTYEEPSQTQEGKTNEDKIEKTSAESPVKEENKTLKDE